MTTKKLRKAVNKKKAFHAYSAAALSVSHHSKPADGAL